MPKLDWKIPTWPGLLGLLALASAVVTQVGDVTGLPSGGKVALASIGGALVIVERVAQAIDNAVASNGSAVSAVVTEAPAITPAPIAAPVASTVPEVAVPGPQPLPSNPGTVSP